METATSRQETGVQGAPYRSLTQIVLENLRERILEGTYEPGARLNISDLAQQFDVSPVPVREALRNLETEGLVQFRLNRGVVVRELSPHEVRELLLIRRPLEALAVAEAARSVTAEDCEALREILTRMDRIGEGAEWHRLHSEFHHALSALSRLPRLINLIDLFRGQMRPYSKLYLSNPEHVRQAQAEHHQMVDLLQAGEIAGLQGLIHEHLGRPARMALNALGAGDWPLDIDVAPPR